MGQTVTNLLSLPPSLNPCFGGFGWERPVNYAEPYEEIVVLILVLVDLGGKGLLALIKTEKPQVLILVLVDLGGKEVTQCLTSSDNKS